MFFYCHVRQRGQKCVAPVYCRLPFLMVRCVFRSLLSLLLLSSLLALGTSRSVSSSHGRLPVDKSVLKTFAQEKY